jgi:hypothetical protein
MAEIYSADYLARRQREADEAIARVKRNELENERDEERLAIMADPVIALGPKAFPTINARKIAEPLPPIRWLCESLSMMAGGRPVMISGYGNVGKTFAAQELALAVAAGRETFWGGIPLQLSGPVLHLDYEQGDLLTRWRYHRLAYGLGLELAALEDKLLLSTLPGDKLTDAGAEAKLVTRCQGAALVLIDSYNAGCPGLDENASTAGEPLQMLLRVSQRTGAAIVVLHHEGKPAADGGRAAAHRVRGSSAIHAALGGGVSFSSEDGTIKIEPSKSPLGLEPETRFFRFVDVGAVDENTRRPEGIRLEWLPVEQVTAEREKRSQKEPAAAALRTGLLDAIRNSPGITRNHLFDLVTGGNKQAKQAALSALLSAKAIRYEEGARGAMRFFVTTGSHD